MKNLELKSERNIENGLTFFQERKNLESRWMDNGVLFRLL
jgi:hypothetical protein